ncbi:DMT family transporter [Tsuneonella amylolytica]|uniref:DMT family transporter n=1 Tax=Tsuneonella amylolytica TaxID=2338327 RepID=UPI000EAA14A8|nr:DMT family transporter [Tsuneonella amylolytica]
MPRADHPHLPVFAAILAIGLLSWMDAWMKGAALAIGAFSTVLVRAPISLALVAPVWAARGGRWPSPAVLRLHVARGLTIAVMGFLFFYSLTVLPLAQAIAISFVAPLIALFLAGLLLGERIGRGAIAGSLLGFAGVLVIVGGKLVREMLTPGAGLGIAAVLASAVFYAVNLVLARKQAQVAGPLEVALFQNLVCLLAYAAFAPWFLELPETAATWRDIGISAALSVAGAMLFAWAYARAETQRLAPVEYSGFVWAALFGWLHFGEAVTGATVAGAVLIVAGCWIATRGAPPPPEQTIA